MQSLALTRLLHNIIRENGKYRHDNYEVDIKTLSNTDKKLLISHVADSDEYEYACSSPVRLDAMFAEYADHIESLINDECYTVFCEDMEESGMIRITYPGNDEVAFVRRSL